MTLLKLLSDKKITVDILGSSNAHQLSKALGKTVTIVEDPKSKAAELIGSYDGIQGFEEEMYRIIKIEPENVFIRIDGIFDSYGSKEWNGIPYEVFPTTVQRVEYTTTPTEPVESVPNTAVLSFDQLLYALRSEGLDSNSSIAHELQYAELSELVGPVELKSSWGGEDEGSQIGRVFYFPKHNIYMRIDGYYQSHYGSDWDNAPYEVKPAEKTITAYDKI